MDLNVCVYVLCLVACMSLTFYIKKKTSFDIGMHFGKFCVNSIVSVFIMTVTNGKHLRTSEGIRSFFIIYESSLSLPASVTSL